MRRLLGDRDMSWHEFSYRAKGAFAVILSIVILAGGALFVYSKAAAAWKDFRTAEDYVGDGEKDVKVTIPQGVAVYEISDILVEKDIVKSANTFDKEAARDSQSANIQGGTYRLRTKLPARKALEMLLNPDNLARNKVTISEGLRLSAQLERLAAPREEGEATKRGTGVPLEEYKKVLADPEQVKKLGLPEWAKGNPEGVLFPDTYNFAEDGNAAANLKAMVDGFNKAVADTDFVNAANAHGTDPYSALIVASIIEKEVRNPSDGKRVARVLYNRVEKGMPLGLDSTVYYATNKEPGVELTKEELQSDHPYNTYTHQGLPPGPLGAPGKNSMVAASSPSDEKDILYFTTVNYDTGETRFEKSQEEHDRNVEVFRKWCREHKDKCTK